MKNKMLEEVCTFIDECDIGSFCNFEICKEDYINCVHYQRIIAKKIEKYNKDRIEVLK